MRSYSLIFSVIFNMSRQQQMWEENWKSQHIRNLISIVANSMAIDIPSVEKNYAKKASWKSSKTDESLWQSFSISLSSFHNTRNYRWFRVQSLGINDRNRPKQTKNEKYHWKTIKTANIWCSFSVHFVFSYFYCEIRLFRTDKPGDWFSCMKH